MRRIARALSAHPIVTAVLLICTFAGAVAGTMLLQSDWSIVRRALGGAIAGAGVGLTVTAARMIG